ncbi:TetR/AcrR family transcriptional regulator [Tindallia californiensis]|uniref:DNA-binding transcriptional regulator, AcrR family n=1 Tax=Tindallia californiensis TaxID=159292 RepID=A0A1H3L641_9FIRM|nr:TetR/AcrR family transcriptional regulator [Tindallia californiensis]SDY59883.1 DNA-binding transcriptional regulator, AcrR family [Tindallia californiensis]
MKEHQSAEKIKRISMRLFNEKGYEATTIRDICNEIGITAPSFYYYFDSKELLYMQMIKEAEALHQEVIEAAIESCPSQVAEERLLYIYKALLDYYRKQKEEYTFLLRNVLFPVASMGERIQEMHMTWRKQYAEKVSEFVASSQKKKMPKADMKDILEAFHRFVTGYMLQLISGQKELSEEHEDKAWEFFWNGIK